MEYVALPNDAELHRLEPVVAVAIDVEGLAVQYGALLLALAHAITDDWSEAEDVVQTTFEIALRNAGRLREPAAAKAWLIRIETREAFRLRRRLRRFVSLESHVKEMRDQPDREGVLDLRRAIRKLPPRMRAALLLHHYLGLSVEETSAALGVSPNTTKTQLRRGLASVRKELT
jgi:RNA polymerase sigma factor (sigma-70 family)